MLIAAFWTLPIPALYFCSRLCPPPEPYIRIPQLPYWGWDYQTIGHEFVRANSIIFLVFAVYPMLLLWFNRTPIEKRKRFHYWAWTAVLPFCFLLALTPFLTERVWVYGHIEHRVDQACQSQLMEIHLALLRYAADHDHRLPIAEDYQSLLPQIQPYLNLPETASIWNPCSNVCIIGKALDRSPQSFIWDTSLSGKEVVRNASWESFDVREEMFDRQTNPYRPAFCGRAEFIVGTNWVDCPYAQTRTRRWPGPVPFSAKDFQPETFRVIHERRTEESEL